MRTQEIYTDYQDHFEYFGDTEIERILKKSYSMTGSILTLSMRTWNFSTIASIDSWATMPDVLPAFRLLQ